jgi:hypothetical protein
MAGAFGDARHGVELGAQDRNEMDAVRNATGQAYNTAFNTAAGMRGQDISNLIGMQGRTRNWTRTRCSG